MIQEDCFLRTQGGGGVDRLDVTVYLGSSQFQVQKIEARLIFSYPPSPKPLGRPRDRLPCHSQLNMQLSLTPAFDPHNRFSQLALRHLRLTLDRFFSA